MITSKEYARLVLASRRSLAETERRMLAAETETDWSMLLCLIGLAGLVLGAAFL